MNDIEPDLDVARVEALALSILKVIRANYIGMSASRVRLYESLNALAINVSIILSGAGYDPEAILFFHQALQSNLEDMKDETKGSQGLN